MITQLPLPFGNFTLTFIALSITFTMLYFVTELGIFIIKKTLALDTEDAPVITIKNPIGYFKLPTLFYYVVDKEGKLLSSDNHNWFNESTVQGVWFGKKEAEQKVSSVPRAVGIKKAGFVSTVTSVISLGLLLDGLVLLFIISFLPTICVTLTLTTMFCVRALAKRFYSGMKNHKVRLDGHDKEIETLKEKG